MYGYERHGPAFSKGLIAGLSRYELCKVFGIHRNTLLQWIQKEKIYSGPDPVRQVVSVYRLLVERGVLED